MRKCLSSELSTGCFNEAFIFQLELNIHNLQESTCTSPYLVILQKQIKSVVHF